MPLPYTESELATIRNRYPIKEQWDHPTESDQKYPPDWQARRQAVLQLYGSDCGRCAIPVEDDETAHVHHIKPIERSGTHEIQNLVPLCSACHALIHPNNPELDADWSDATLFPSNDADPRVAVERRPTNDFERAVYDDRMEEDGAVDNTNTNMWAQSEATTATGPESAMARENPLPEDYERLDEDPPFDYFCDECRSLLPSQGTTCDDCQVGDSVSLVGRIKALFTPQ